MHFQREKQVRAYAWKVFFLLFILFRYWLKKRVKKGGLYKYRVMEEELHWHTQTQCIQAGIGGGIIECEEGR